MRDIHGVFGLGDDNVRVCVLYLKCVEARWGSSQR